MTPPDIHSVIGDVTPKTARQAFHVSLNADEKAAQSLNQKFLGKPGTVQSSIALRPLSGAAQEECNIALDGTYAAQPAASFFR